MDIGITTNDECINEFQAMKMKQAWRFLTFKLTPDFKEVVVDVKGDRGTTWEEFLKELPKKESRYIVYDYHFVTHEKPPRDLTKLIFIYWGPDDAPVKQKTIYATNKEKFKAKIGCSKEFQATDLSDLNKREIEDSIGK